MANDVKTFQQKIYLFFWEIKLALNDRAILFNVQ